MDQVQIPGKNGYLAVPGHAPLITELMIGEISYTKGGTTVYLALSWGFAEVLPDKVTILADTAERAEDIDVARAQEAKTRRGRGLAESGTGPGLRSHEPRITPRRSKVGSGCASRPHRRTLRAASVRHTGETIRNNAFEPPGL